MAPHLLLDAQTKPIAKILLHKGNQLTVLFEQTSDNVVNAKLPQLTAQSPMFSGK